MKAVILAGGKGTRLKPYTYVLPKPLVPVGEKPILAILIEKLKKSGVTDMVFCVNHMAELIRAYFGDGKEFGVNIEYSKEKKALGTVAPLKLIKELPQDFIVINGDILTDLEFKKIFDHHLAKKRLITVGVYQREVKIDFGVIKTEKNMIKEFQEKPIFKFTVSMGIYVFNRRILDFVPNDQKYGFDDLILGLLQNKEKINTYNFKGYWLDLGRMEDFERANLDLIAGKLE